MRLWHVRRVVPCGAVYEQLEVLRVSHVRTTRASPATTDTSTPRATITAVAATSSSLAYSTTAFLQPIRDERAVVREQRSAGSRRGCHRERRRPRAATKRA